MNRIETLIAELCPEGVEWKALGDVCESISSGKNKDKNINGVYPVYGSTGVIGYADEYRYSSPNILVARVGANCGYVNKALGKYDVSDNTLIINVKKNNSLQFFYYLLINMQLNNLAVGAGQPLITAGKLKPLLVPTPPLAIQQEIVDILDKFTALEARKTQYEFYRNSLLTFEKGVPHFSPKIETLIAELCPEGGEWKALGDVAAYSDTRVDAINLSDENFVGVDNLLSNKGGKSAASYLPNTARLTAYEKGDVLLGNIRPYLKKVWLADSNGGCSGDVLAIRIASKFTDSISSEYLYYLLSSDSFFAYNMQHAKGAKMPRGSKSAILGYEIPLPPLAIQQKIVAILDKFDALVNDIAIGLPAEIAARRKQYEYYREKLLTFKRKEA